MTKFQQHVRRWQGCRLCPLHKTRDRVVLCRGKLPCDLLFLGEAPGESENVIGLPFVGPAGHLLDSIIAAAVPTDVRCAFSNVVACIPYEDEGDGLRKASEPPDESVLACQDRLREFILLAAPQTVVCVGKLADDWTDPKFKKALHLSEFGECQGRNAINRVCIAHPAHILRMNVMQRGLAIQRCVVTVRNAVNELVPF